MNTFLSLFAMLCLLLSFPCAASADLEAHFLDVGHGDCTIITCDGESMIIDGGNSGCSELVFNYLTNHGITELKYAVATHPDSDHVGGLPAAFHAANVQTLFSPVKDSSEKRFGTLIKTAKQKSVPLIVPDAGATYSLGDAKITILSPVIMFADTNDISIVLRIDYGSTSFLFTGDASTAVEKDLIARSANLDADVLKVSHHGSSTATSSAFVSAVSPEVAVISCAHDTDYPSWDVLYALADTSVLITAQKGTIILRADADGLKISADSQQATKPDSSYVGNKNSMIFHYSTCESVSKMKEKNKVFFSEKEQAEKSGYRPCNICDP